MGDVGCVASDLGRVGPKPPRNPSIRSSVRAIIDAVSGFSSVSCLETWRIPVPRIRDRLHRIEPCSPNSRPGVRPEGLSLALPKAAPEDTFAAVGASLLRPLGHLGRSAPCTLAGSSRLRHGSCGTGRSFTTRRSAIASWLAASPSRSIPGRYRSSSRVSLRPSPGSPVVDLQAGRFSPKLPLSPFL